MSTFTTRYDIGQTVWSIRNNQVLQWKIVSIKTEILPDSREGKKLHVYYILNRNVANDTPVVPEELVFSSKQKLLDSL